jgi:hypothetical protein
MRVINWTHILLDKDQRPKRGKLRINLHGTILEGKSSDSNPTKTLKRRAHDLKTLNPKKESS